MSLGSWSRKGGSFPCLNPRLPSSEPQGAICSSRRRPATRSPARFYHWRLGWLCRPICRYEACFCDVPCPGRRHPQGSLGLEGPRGTINNCSCLWEGQAAPESSQADGRLSYFFYCFFFFSKISTRNATICLDSQMRLMI